MLKNGHKITWIFLKSQKNRDDFKKGLSKGCPYEFVGQALWLPLIIYFAKNKTGNYFVTIPNQKQENKELGKKRVFVEHTIGGMKAFHILSTRFRNRSHNLLDEVAFLVAGLWNLKMGSYFNKL